MATRRRLRTREHDGSDSYATYVEYNKILRTWFVAFGIGGPALFLINSELAKRLSAEGDLRYTATLFLIGAASQVFGAFLNKVTNWYVYESAHPDAKRNWKYDVANCVIEWFWIDFVIDILTIVCFGMASWQVLMAFAK